MNLDFARLQCVHAFCALIFLSSTAAYAESKNPPVERVKQMALQQCLNNNYENIQAYKPIDLNDASYYVERVQLDRDGTDKRTRALSTFVKEQTDTFHMGGPSLKSESGRLHNSIFEKCMSFYHSTSLDSFIRVRLLKP
ncbi:hypothetical protein [Pseudomonas chlororaphis]|uniref:hypothetical protein n=1 Tax=Pseudomonas chlororaphis TaxID=587753 RepID=UPI0004722B98